MYILQRHNCLVTRTLARLVRALVRQVLPALAPLLCTTRILRGIMCLLQRHNRMAAYVLARLVPLVWKRMGCSP